MTDEGGGGPPKRTLADKINRLFDEMHPRNRGPLSNDEVAAAINARGGVTISASYLWLLRTGRRDNPGLQHLEALAAHFGVTPAYFFDDEIAAQIDKDLDLIAAMREAGVTGLALRAADLSPDVQEAIRVMIEQARKVQGLEDAPSKTTTEPRPPPRPQQPRTDRETRQE